EISPESSPESSPEVPPALLIAPPFVRKRLVAVLPRKFPWNFSGVISRGTGGFASARCVKECNRQRNFSGNLSGKFSGSFSGVINSPAFCARTIGCGLAPEISLELFRRYHLPRICMRAIGCDFSTEIVTEKNPALSIAPLFCERLISSPSPPG
ncbi:unnamed protein product, partial [Laminaria digitata]